MIYGDGILWLAGLKIIKHIFYLCIHSEFQRFFISGKVIVIFYAHKDEMIYRYILTNKLGDNDVAVYVSLLSFFSLFLLLICIFYFFISIKEKTCFRYLTDTKQWFIC